MSAWVLVLVLGAGSSQSTTTVVGFSSQEACMQSGKVFDDSKEMSFTSIRYVCLEVK